MSAGRRSVSGPGKRALVALAVGALAAPFTFAGVASAAARDISVNACPQDQVTGPETPFTDIAGLSPEAQLAIRCIADYGITQGTEGNTFAPANRVSRAQMALFLARLLVQTGIPLDDTGGRFDDIGGLSEDAQSAVNALANLGVTTGVAERRYVPTAAVTRAQMASFLARTAEALEVALLPPAADQFTDDQGSVHEGNVNRVAQAGLAQGLGGGLFGPSVATSRAQMALFLARLTDLLVEEALVDLPPEYIDGPEPGAPGLSAAVILDEGDVDGVLDEDDVVVLDFAAAVTAQSAIVLEDADGDVTVLSDDQPAPGTPDDGVTVATVTGSGTTQLRFTVAAPVDVAGEGNGTVALPVRIVAATGVQSAEGVEWDPAVDPGAQNAVGAGEDPGLPGDDVTGPAFVSSVPAANAVNVAVDATLTATFAETLAEDSTAVLLAEDATTPVPGVTTVSGATITFDPTGDLEPGTSYTVTFEGRDEAGNETEQDVPFTTASAADVTGPAFVSSEPAANAVDVALDVTLTATFGETLAEGSTAVLVAEGATTPVAGAVTVSGATVTLDPTGQLEAGTTYTVTFEGRDEAGNETEQDVTFTTVSATP